MLRWPPYCLLLVLLVPLSVSADIIDVPGDEPDLASALAAANLFGDEIVLADGTYTGAGNRGLTVTKNVTIRSASGNPAACVIDCQGQDRAFSFDGVTSFTRLEGLTITGGLASLGGAFNCINGADPTIVGVHITGNTANGLGGGGVHVTQSSAPLFVNCTFTGNSTSGVGLLGGAVYVNQSGTPTLTNCSFSLNSGWDFSSVAAVNAGAVATLVNCVVWGEAPGQSGDPISGYIGGVVNVTYSLVERGYAGTGNVSSNPGYLDPDGADNVAGTADDDLSIGKFSAAIDAGDKTATGLSGITTDRAGNPRYYDDANVADSGAGSAPLVDMGAFERQTDSQSLVISVPGDEPTIQAGIDAAQVGDVVELADMTFTGAGNRDLLLEKDITIRSAGGDPALCVIDAQSGARVLTFDGATSGTRIEGITFANGTSATGGGVFCGNGSSPVVVNCRFVGNVATGTGGGGFYVEAASSPTLINCKFSGNDTVGLGTVGGALYVKGASTPTLVNCSMSGNSAWDVGGIQSEGAGTVTTLVNCISWGEDPGFTGPPIADRFSSVTNITYSCIEDGYAGVGNIASNPIFMDAELRLAPVSPCIDTGSNAAVTEGTDCDGNPRIHDGDAVGGATVDMGAFEYGAGATGIGEGPGLSAGVLLLARPNPMTHFAALRLTLPAGGPTTIRVVDARGRLVRSIVEGDLPAGGHEFRWDGRDTAGRRVAAGWYLAVVDTPAGRVSARLVRLP